MSQSPNVVPHSACQLKAPLTEASLPSVRPVSDALLCDNCIGKLKDGTNTITDNDLQTSTTSSSERVLAIDTFAVQKLIVSPHPTSLSPIQTPNDFYTKGELVQCSSKSPIYINDVEDQSVVNSVHSKLEECQLSADTDELLSDTNRVPILKLDLSDSHLSNMGLEGSQDGHSKKQPRSRDRTEPTASRRDRTEQTSWRDREKPSSTEPTASRRDRTEPTASRRDRTEPTAGRRDRTEPTASRRDRTEQTSWRDREKPSSWRDREEFKKHPKPKRPKPNSFIAVRISSSVIKEKLQHVQEAMVDYDARLGQILTSLKKLHISLMVIRMETDDDIERGRRALHEASDAIRTQLVGKPLVLKFSRLNTFGSKVVFSSVSDGLDELHSVVRIIRDVFLKNGLKSTDTRNSFNPHATIAKVSKSRVVKSIPHKSYSNYLETEFGVETIVSIELLSMTEPATDDGYYYCFERAQFS